MFSNNQSRFFPIDRQIVVSTETLNRGYRLDPSRYSGEGEDMLRHIKQLGVPCKNIGGLEQFEEVYLPNRFTRIYLDHPEYGAPMLGTSSMFMIRLPRDAAIRLKDPQKSSPLWIRPGDILVSRSGTVGTSVICGKSYSNYIASDDCFRLRIGETMRGYVAAFLQSHIGMTLLKRDAHGKVIKHLKDHDIKNAIIPLIAEPERSKIGSLMMNAVVEIDKARGFFESAEALFGEILPIKTLAANQNRWLSPSKVSFLQSSYTLDRSRMDPHFYNPPVSALRSAFNTEKTLLLGAIAQVWGVPRFKRLHADEDHGTPLFSSADIMRARLTPSAYLSVVRNAKQIKQCRVVEGTILVSCSGAYGGILGRAVRVPKYLHEAAITQHVVRVKVIDERFDVDFVAGLLSSLRVAYPIITAFRYGKDVPEIAPDDLKTIPIPLLERKDQERISRLIRQACDAIDKANTLEDQAQTMLLDALKWTKTDDGHGKI